MTGRVTAGAYIAAVLIWALVAYTHRFAAPVPGRAPSMQGAVNLFLVGLGVWVGFGVLIWAFGRTAPQLASFGTALAAAGLAQIPFGLEAVGGLMMRSPGWAQVVGYGVATFALILGFPITLIALMRRYMNIQRAVAVAGGLVTWYVWLTWVWGRLVR